jgi:L-lactate dehydrogenase complex protein LldE
MKIGLFIPCYVDALYPEVGMSTYKLLRHVGVDVTYPQGQTCCGQPMANAGFESKAVPLARKLEALFRDFDYVVAPSVSCTAFIRINYPRLLDHECQMAKRAMDVVEFIHDVVKVGNTEGTEGIENTEKVRLGSFPHKVSLHNSCHGVRELGLSSPSEMNVPKFNKIRDLLQLVDGIEVVEPERADECCGFGGMFSVEETAVSAQMGRDKVERHIATGAEYVTGPDCSCLMHMAGVAKKQGLDIKFKHVVEILAAGL